MVQLVKGQLLTVRCGQRVYLAVVCVCVCVCMVASQSGWCSYQELDCASFCGICFNHNKTVVDLSQPDRDSQYGAAWCSCCNEVMHMEQCRGAS